MAMPMMGSMGPSGMGKDPNKGMAMEKENLDMLKHKFSLNGVEEYYLQMK